MGQVVIKCPNTGKTVPTGTVMDKQLFDAADISGNEFGPCPACHLTHKWDKKDAWIQE